MEDYYIQTSPRLRFSTVVDHTFSGCVSAANSRGHHTVIPPHCSWPLRNYICLFIMTSPDAFTSQCTVARCCSLNQKLSTSFLMSVSELTSRLTAGSFSQHYQTKKLVINMIALLFQLFYKYRNNIVGVNY